MKSRADGAGSLPPSVPTAQRRLRRTPRPGGRPATQVPSERTAWAPPPVLTGGTRAPQTAHLGVPLGRVPGAGRRARKQQLSKAWALGRGPLAAVLPLPCCVRSRVSPPTPSLPLRWPQSPPTAPVKQRCGTWSLQQLELQGSVSCFKKSRKASWRGRRVLGADGKAKPAEAEGRAPLGWGQVRAEGQLEGGGEEATSLSGADVRLGRKQSCQGCA